MSNAATVAQLVGFDAVGLISMIRQAAQTAQQNRKDCENLARRAGILGVLLPQLQQQDPEAMRLMAGLRGALEEAHELVASCQGRGRTHRFVTASRVAERFRDVERKIESYVSIFPMISHIAIARRLDSSTGSSSSTYYLQPQPQSSSAAAEEAAGLTFTLAEIRVATDNFAVVLGDGDSGTVYKGRLRDGREVAVKRLKPAGRRDAECAFVTECTILSPLRHDHIVRLVGSCADGGERIIVTQFIPNGSLHDHLNGGTPHHHPSPVTATWRARVQVLLGAARAVKHLHCHAVPLVIHANVSSSNILLEASTAATVSAAAAWTPRLSGFGASVWRAAGVESQAVEVAAADGYADPEHRSTGRLKPASDVYGLGVVMLEVLTGKPPVVAVWDEGSGAVVRMTLASFALPSIQAGRLLDVLDRRPVSSPTIGQLQPLELVASIAARCLLLHGDNRPPIADVVANLERALDLICSRGRF